MGDRDLFEHREPDAQLAAAIVAAAGEDLLSLTRPLEDGSTPAADLERAALVMDALYPALRSSIYSGVRVLRRLSEGSASAREIWEWSWAGNPLPFVAPGIQRDNLCSESAEEFAFVIRYLCVLGLAAPMDGRYHLTPLGSAFILKARTLRHYPAVWRPLDPADNGAGRGSLE